MKRKLLTLLLILVGSLLFVATAQAVNIPACQSLNLDNSPEFALVGSQWVKFEGGPTTIDGNVLVTGVGGFAQLGTNTRIEGTLSADEIRFRGSNAFVGECESLAGASLVTNNGNTCGVNDDAFSTFSATNLPPGCQAALDAILSPVCTANACTSGAANITVAAGATLTLAPGCYGVVRLNRGATLILADPTGIGYTFQSVRMVTESSLIGAPALPVPPTRVAVEVNGLFVTEAAVTISNVNVRSNSSIGSVIVIGHSSNLINAHANAPCGNIHIHSRSKLFECSELTGETLTIEPITSECTPPVPPLVCVCPSGSQFTVEVCDELTSCVEARSCERCGGVNPDGSPQPPCRPIAG